ncbi:MAG TPA: Hsp20/alpha crystallin family protein [candidate division Zixibacteria bacterium]|nr:Hsp20/alpha crystallin family protein [candidate division Zixibacteria bacterium]
MTALIRWDPFRELASWHRDIDELFDRLFSFDRGGISSLAAWMPAVESFTKDGQYVIRVDLPGVDPKDMEVSVLENRLTVRGERKASKEVDRAGYRYTEASYGKFERTLSLPEGVDRDKIAAKYEHGVLEISIPLPAGAVAKKVPIEIAGGEVKQLKAA